MRRVWFLIAAAAVLMACEHNEPVVTPPSGGGGSSGGNGGGTATKQASVGFTCQRTAPLMYEFTNTSTGCDSYKWDFGDGTWSEAANATHAFESFGTYTVTLSGTANGETLRQRKTITITQPTIYIAGYVLYAIPTENRYYKLSFKDDSLFPSDWDFVTAYTPLLTSADMPYETTWNNPRALDNPENHDYYKVQLIRNTTTSNKNNDYICMTVKMQVADILKYPNSLIYTSESTATKVGIKFKYDY